MVFVVKDIIVIFRKIKTIVILIRSKRYFSYPEKSILKDICYQILPKLKYVQFFAYSLFNACAIHL